ncbi:hypothetical protein ACOMHN_037208 [Nucella lapillus]
MSTTMAAEPVLNRQTNIHYRRKPPSAQRRDRERAAKQQQRKRVEQADSCCDSTGGIDELFMPETQYKQTDSDTGDVTEERNTTTHEEHSDGEAAAKAKAHVLHVQDSLPCGSDCAVDLNLPETNSDIEPVIESIIDGFDAGTVKNYVATLTDRSLQRRLRNQNRNNAFRRVVLQSDDADLLLFESDDIVLEYSLHPSSNDTYAFWYIKQEDRNILDEERGKLANLRNGIRTRNTEHTETRALALCQLHVLNGLLKLYLG